MTVTLAHLLLDLTEKGCLVSHVSADLGCAAHAGSW
jgi:hypothetical protein